MPLLSEDSEALKSCKFRLSDTVEARDIERVKSLEKHGLELGDLLYCADNDRVYVIITEYSGEHGSRTDGECYIFLLDPCTGLMCYPERVEGGIDEHIRFYKPDKET